MFYDFAEYHGTLTTGAYASMSSSIKVSCPFDDYILQWKMHLESITRRGYANKVGSYIQSVNVLLTSLPRIARIHAITHCIILPEAPDIAQVA